MNENPDFHEPKTSRERLLRRIWSSLPALSVLLLLVLIIGLFAGISKKSERIKAEKMAGILKSRPPVNVVALETTAKPIRDRLNLPGVVEPWVELSILAEIHAKVTGVMVKEGDRVEKGDIIALLDASDYENALASARASHDLALKTHRRTLRLYKEELISKARLDEIIAEVESLDAAVKNAELKVKRTSIRAPIAGIINRLDAKEGLLLSISDPVAVILDIDRVKVSVGIPESDVDAVRKLSEFDLTIDALGGRAVHAKKLFFSKSPDSLARLYKLELEVNNPRGEILPGMFAKVNIIKKEVKKAISVPLYSVISRNEQQFVFLEKDGKAEVRQVETGILEGWQIQITKGLKIGERVIIVGHRSIDEGQEVNVIRTVKDMEAMFK